MFDLNIPIETLAADPSQLLEFIYKFGYRSIAITVDHKEHLSKLKACSIDKTYYSQLLQQKVGQDLRPPLSILAHINSGFTPKAFQIYTRVNLVEFSSNQSALKTYDLISVEPINDKTFQNACSSEADIITLDLTNRLPFQLKYSTVSSAIQRGILFEICYSGSIRDASCRKNFISNACHLLRVTQGKNIILSSGAREALEVRGPFDVMNMANLFSMNASQAKEALTVNPRHCLGHAASRHTFKSAGVKRPFSE